MRWATLTLIGISLVVYLAVFGREGLDAALFFFPFTMTPFVLIALLAFAWRSAGSQIVLLLAALGYAAWFVSLYVYAMIRHPDPQSPIALLFVGIYAAPVLLVLWFVAYAFEWRHRADLLNRGR